MARTGADLVVEALTAAGVKNLFTLSGNQILSVYDATNGRAIRLIHTRHEAAAVHMADGWGRLKPMAIHRRRRQIEASGTAEHRRIVGG